MPRFRSAFDTNLLFYAVNEDSPFHAAAAAFISSMDTEDVVISELVLVELYRLLRDTIVCAQPMSAQGAADVIQNFRRHPRWRLVALPAEQRELHDRLWQMAAEYGFSYRRIYDARLALSLMRQGVTDFATVNLRDFQDMGFRRIWNPLEANDSFRSG